MAFRDFAVSTSFRAKDKLSKAFRAMSAGAKRFGDNVDKSFRKGTQAASRFKDVTSGILAAGAISRGLRLLSGGLRSVTEQFVDFDQATIGAAARFKDIGPDAVDFQNQLSKIRDRAREAGATTEFTAAQSAEALNFLAKAGFTSAEAFGSLNSMINLATATGEDFATVADFSSDLLGSFGLNVDDTAQKIKNLARLNDVLVKAANTANVTVEDLFETMKIAAPIGSKLGQSLESVTAVTAFLGGAGIKGSQSATALKNAFLKLAAPSSTASKMLKALGIQVEDDEGNMRQLNEIIGELAPKLNKMGNVKAAKILNEIFGKRAIAGAINIGEGTEAIREFEKSLLDAGGTAQKTADLIRKSLGNRIKALGSASTELGFKLLEAFEVRGESAIDALTKAIRNFDPEPIINGIEFAVEVFKNLWSILKPFLPFMPWFIGAWLTFGATMKILALARIIAGFITFTSALFGSAGAMGVLNAVMAANPVGAIIIGVVALVAIFIKFKKEIIGIGKIILAGLILPLESVLKLIGLIPGFGSFTKAGEQAAAFRQGLIQEGLGAFEDKRVAPNQEEAAARREIGFEGRVRFENAPPGTTVAGTTTGAPDIELDMLGVS